MRSIPWLLCGVILPAIFAVNPPTDTFRADATMVLVDVSVVDSHDRPVAGLDRHQFHVFERGQEQPIVSFSHEDAPVSIGLIFDSSGSMGGKLKRAREIVARFCADLNPEDEMFLVIVRKSVSMAMDYTTNCGDIQSALLSSKSEGLTALLDAIPLAVRHLKSAHNRRRAILLISDGGENASRAQKAEIRRLTREASVPIYTAALTTMSQAYQEVSSEEQHGPDLLREIVECSGGRYWEIDDVTRLRHAADRMAAEIHDQYLIGFRAPSANRDGKFRRISVKVARDAAAPHLTLFYRSGYYAPAD
jgi:Ca-activated chloride channel family protein